MYFSAGMVIVFGDNDPKCSKCYDRKAKVAFRTSNAVIAEERETEGKRQMLLWPRKRLPNLLI